MTVRILQGTHAMSAISWNRFIWPIESIAPPSPPRSPESNTDIYLILCTLSPAVSAIVGFSPTTVIWNPNFVYLNKSVTRTNAIIPKYTNGERKERNPPISGIFAKIIDLGRLLT